MLVQLKNKRNLSLLGDEAWTDRGSKKVEAELVGKFYLHHDNGNANILAMSTHTYFDKYQTVSILITLQT